MINVIEIEGMNDLIQAIENGGGGGGSDVPEPTSADRGKFLGVSTNSNDLEYREVKELPTSTSGDSGKVLTVGSTGTPEWATSSSGGVTTFGGTTAQGEVSFIEDVGNIIEFRGNDISNIANLGVGDAIVQIYNNESYIYTISEMTPSRDVYCNYDNRVKVAKSSAGGATIYSATILSGANVVGFEITGEEIGEDPQTHDPLVVYSVSIPYQSDIYVHSTTGKTVEQAVEGDLVICTRKSSEYVSVTGIFYIDHYDSTDSKFIIQKASNIGMNEMPKPYMIFPWT